MAARVRGGACVALACGFAACGIFAAPAQETPAPWSVLEQTPLVIWVVGPATEPRGARIAGLEGVGTSSYREQTAGSFGQSASSFGRPASSYGVASSSPAVASAPPAGVPQPPREPATGEAEGQYASTYREVSSGSFGQTAGSFGEAASNTGQTAASLGQPASTYGTAASNRGTGVGNFGHSLSTLAQAGELPKPAPTPLLQRLSSRAREAFPGERMTFVDVAWPELKEELARSAGTGQAPDLLVGPLPPELAKEIRARYLVTMLPAAASVPDGLQSVALTAAERSVPAFAITLQAPHARAARAFALWLSEAANGEALRAFEPPNLDADAAGAAAVARKAVTLLVHGGGLGAAGDPEMAAFPPQLMQLVLRTSSGTGGDEGLPEVQVTGAQVRGALAAVRLRVLVSGAQVFGVAHPLVVLRRSPAGPWRVLQVSLNLAPAEQNAIAQRLLQPVAETAEHAAPLRPVSLAAPEDGGTRPDAPQLWWDNHGGAGLEVVEWQRGVEGRWGDSHLYLVPDGGAVLQTRTTAEFAVGPAEYRWRVWSVGRRGEVAMTGWRRVTIAP